MVKHCSYGICKNDSRKQNASTMTNRYGQPVFFLRFPGKKRNREKAKRWINACRRPKYQLSIEKLSYHHVICSLHFVGENGPTADYPDPLPATISAEKRDHLENIYERSSTGKRTWQSDVGVGLVGLENDEETDDGKRFKNEDLESLKDGVDKLIDSQSSGEGSRLKFEFEIAEALLEMSKCIWEPQSSVEESHEASDVIDDLTAEHKKFNLEQSSHSENLNVNFEDVNTNCEDLNYESTQNLQNVEGNTAESKNCPSNDSKQIIREHFVACICKDPMHYTGVKSLELLKYIFSLVEEKASRMSLWRGQEKSQRKLRGRNLSLWEEFLLTLVRNRRGTDIQMIADLFGTYKSNASNVYITWNLFLCTELRFLRQFTTADKVEENLPKSLKKKNGEPKDIVKGVRTIIDAAEFRCEAPSLPAPQKQLYSSYYNDNTYKLLIGCTPNGYINYASCLWSGNVTDKELVQKCGFVDCLTPGDIVMADKGFGIRGELALKGCKLHIPPKLKGKTLKPRASAKARKISNARIHIERTIRRLRTYRVLSNIQKLTQKSYMDSVVQVCISLANLGNSLVT